MPYYQRRGTLPPKRHTVLPKGDGGIHYEELIGNEGFTGASSLLYRLRRPTQVKTAELDRQMTWEWVASSTLVPRHFRLAELPAGGNLVQDRTPFLFNADVALSVARPAETGTGFYRNGQGDEIVYVARGSGVLECAQGNLRFGEGDYLIIPRGLVHRYDLVPGDPFFLVAESRGVVKVPKRYRNDYGQLVEGAPYAERDIRAPQDLVVHDETGEFPVLTKMNNALTRHVLAAHPFDVVGWDGAYYPWAFNIRDFEPIVGRIHQPPPVHQTFQGDGFVVCSFVPRLYDFDPHAIPAPYSHSNAQSDEVLFYANEEFMSRKGIVFGSVTHHPDGMPHGPQPGKAEESIGKTRTNELAVMVDTFRPLRVAKAAVRFEDPGYTRSWLE